VVLALGGHSYLPRDDRELKVPQRGHAASGRAKRTDTSNPPPGALTAPVTSKSSNPDSTRVTSPISGPPRLGCAYCQTREAPTRIRGPSHHSTCPTNRVEPPNPGRFTPRRSNSGTTCVGGANTAVRVTSDLSGFYPCIFAPSARAFPRSRETKW